jgi:hypothetical protein
MDAAEKQRILAEARAHCDGTWKPADVVQKRNELPLVRKVHVNEPVAPVPAPVSEEQTATWAKWDEWCQGHIRNALEAEHANQVEFMQAVSTAMTAGADAMERVQRDIAALETRLRTAIAELRGELKGELRGRAGAMETKLERGAQHDLARERRIDAVEAVVLRLDKHLRTFLGE